MEPDIAEERLQFWINQGGQPLTSHDAVHGKTLPLPWIRQIGYFRRDPQLKIYFQNKLENRKKE